MWVETTVREDCKYTFIEIKGRCVRRMILTTFFDIFTLNVASERKRERQEGKYTFGAFVMPACVCCFFSLCAIRMPF